MSTIKIKLDKRVIPQQDNDTKHIPKTTWFEANRVMLEAFAFVWLTFISI